MNISKPNVIIILADSARYYSTGGKDDRDKLEVMNRFKNESIYFTTAVSSAPSSIMSVSAMLTSLSSYYIASNYSDFIFDENKFNSITKILMGNGYEIQSAQNARETRERFDTLLPHIHKKYWPKGLKNSEKNWSNNNINKILSNFICNRKTEKPLFLFLFYNVRHDPNTSDEVEKGINILKKHIDWENSIVFLGSDHGYMDPMRGYTPEKLQAMGLGHDLVMSDDNIRVPFYFRFPGFKPDIINEPVSTLDIVPTILDLLAITSLENSKIGIMGSSLMPLIRRNQNAIKFFNGRMVRTDGRFFAQAARSTSIRNYKYKYVTRPEMNIEEFYDLENDQWEINNLITSENLSHIINDFIRFYHESERKAIEFQIENISNKLKSKLLTVTQKEINKILVYGFGEQYYCEILLTALKRIYPKSEIYLLLDDTQQTNHLFKTEHETDNIIFYKIESGICDLRENKDLYKRNFDIGIILGQKKKLGAYEAKLTVLKENFQTEVEIYIDINNNVGVSNNFGNFIKYVNKKKNYYFKNPDAFFRTINKVLYRMLTKLKVKQL